MNIDKDLALSAIERIRVNIKSNFGNLVNDDLNCLVSLIENSNSDYDYLSFTAVSMNGKIIIKLLPFDVVLIESDGRFTTFKTIDGSTYIASRTSIKSIEDVWSDYFVMASRGVLVNPSKIFKIIKEKDNNFAVLIHDLGRVPVSRRQTKVIKEKIKKGIV
jgi:DNA-binding LytR/AlgR family response regulator